MIIRRKLFNTNQSNSPQSPDALGEQLASAQGGGVVSNQHPPSYNGGPPQNVDQPLTSKDLKLEQSRLQRQLMMNNRLRQRIEMEERKAKSRQLLQNQKMAREKDRQENSNILAAQRLEAQKERDMGGSVSLYKTRSNPVRPVPMK